MSTTTNHPPPANPSDQHEAIDRSQTVSCAHCAVATGSPSDTPRTDRWEWEQECNFDVPWEDHCRTLERENTRLRALIFLLRARTLLMRRDVHGNQMVPTDLTRKIDALLANTESSQPRT